MTDRALREEQIAGLLGRVEAATGPDRELGREIMLTLGWQRTCIGHFYGPLYYWSPPGRAGRGYDEDKLPDATASVDAALLLIERVLPGWADTTYSKTTTHGPRAVLVNPDYRIQVGADGATRPLALLAALLKALLPQGSPP